MIVEENSATEHLFYNAIGGKDKCLKFNVCLVNQNQNKVLDRFVNLKAFLTYEDGQYVNNQEILEIKDDSKFTIDATPAHIRFRINEVSSHHQGRRFRVMVTPIEMSSPMLLTPVFCAPIEVKSKMLKPVRPREIQTDLGNESDSYSNSNKKSKVMQNMDILSNIATSLSTTPQHQDAKLSRSVSNKSNEESMESLLNQLLPLVKSVQGTLAAYQIQKRDLSSSVSFPILCRFSLNASQFLNDMTMLGDLLQHDHNNRPLSAIKSSISVSTSEQQTSSEKSMDMMMLPLAVDKVLLTRRQSNVIEEETALDSPSNTSKEEAYSLLKFADSKSTSSMLDILCKAI